MIQPQFNYGRGPTHGNMGSPMGNQGRPMGYPLQPRQSGNLGPSRMTGGGNGLGVPGYGWFNGQHQLDWNQSPVQGVQDPNQGMLPGSRGNVFDPTGRMAPPMIQDPMAASMPPSSPQMDDFEFFNRYGVRPNPTQMTGAPGFQFQSMGNPVPSWRMYG